MSRAEKTSAVITLRIDADLSRSLGREARHRRKIKSEVAREILAAGLSAANVASVEEARRQSILASAHPSGKEVLEFIEHATDTQGWK